MNEETTAEPGMAWAEIARSAYKAYAASTGNKNFQGNPMPEFDDLTQSIKIAWEVAARQVGGCLELKYATDEQRWQGYVPPQYATG